MIDKTAAVKFLTDVLWSEDRVAFREAIGIEHYWFIDNYVALMVMKKYDPERAVRLEESLPNLEDYPRGYDRWCILEGKTEEFRQSPDVLPDWCRYADLLALQYLYHHYAGEFEEANRVYSLLLGQYDGRYITDLATRVGYITYPPEEYWKLEAKPEGHTMYKLCLLAMCSLHQQHPEVAKSCLDTVGDLQVKDGIEKGGIKTEWWNPEWGPKPPHLLTLANTETTSLAILAQDQYDQVVAYQFSLTQAGTALITISIIYYITSLIKRIVKKKEREE